MYRDDLANHPKAKDAFSMKEKNPVLYNTSATSKLRRLYQKPIKEETH